MGNVTFNEENTLAKPTLPPTANRSTGIAGLLIRFGAAKDAKQADIIMIAVIAACILLAGIIIFRPGLPAGGTPDAEAIPYEQI